MFMLWRQDDFSSGRPRRRVSLNFILPPLVALPTTYFELAFKRSSPHIRVDGVDGNQGTPQLKLCYRNISKHIR